MRIDLLRHGQVQGGRKYRGHGIDDPLSEQGWQQLETACAHNPGWTHIVSSPMTRCARFAQTLAEQTALPLSIENDLREVGFGQWEGLSRAQLEQEQPEALAAFLADPVQHRPPGAEPLAAFVSRVGQTLERLRQTGPDGHYLLLVHAGVIRAALAHCLSLPLGSLYQIEVQTAHFTTLQYQQGRWSLQGLNLPRP